MLSLALLVAAACTGGGPSGGPSGTEGAQPSNSVAGVDTVELVAPPTSGAGDSPKFEWKAVDSAASYRLFVLDPDGKPLWAWDGAETSVWLGGLSRQLPEGEAGPRIVTGCTWSVAAFDTDGHALALSDSREVSP